MEHESDISTTILAEIHIHASACFRNIPIVLEILHIILLAIGTLDLVSHQQRKDPAFPVRCSGLTRTFLMLHFRPQQFGFHPVSQLIYE
jgi:hypothetical protein